MNLSGLTPILIATFKKDHESSSFNQKNQELWQRNGKRLRYVYRWAEWEPNRLKGLMIIPLTVLYLRWTPSLKESICLKTDLFLRAWGGGRGGEGGGINEHTLFIYFSSNTSYFLQLKTDSKQRPIMVLEFWQVSN